MISVNLVRCVHYIFEKTLLGLHTQAELCSTHMRFIYESLSTIVSLSSCLSFLSYVLK